MTTSTGYSGQGGAPGAPTAKLIAMSGRNKGGIYLLPAKGEVVIGRAAASDIVLDDSEVSRRHCRVVADGGAYRLEDSGSRNGSFVDGERVAETMLRSGSKIRVGQTTFVLVLTDGTGESGTEEWRAEGPAPVTRRRPWVATAAALAALAALAAFAASFAPRFFGGGTRVIRIDSVPAGAEVFVDDRFVALTPAEVKVGAGGPHALRVTKRGYLTERSRIMPETPSALSINLRPEPEATLLVSANRSDTEVFLDGLFVGRAGPEQPLRVPGVRLGQHELRLQRANYLPYQQQLDITRAGSINIHARLESREESSLLSLIAEQPNSALLFTELGHLRMVNKQFDGAMEAYQKAFELVYGGRDTSNYRSRLDAEFQKLVTGQLFEYGTAAEMQLVCRKLEDVFVLLATQYPAAKTRLSQLAEHYTNKNLVDDAIRLYRKILATQPDDLNLHYRVAALCASRNDHEASIAILRQAADRFPENWSVLYRLGLAYSQRAAVDLSGSDKEKAILCLERALALCPAESNKQTIQYHLAKVKELKID